MEHVCTVFRSLTMYFDNPGGTGSVALFLTTVKVKKASGAKKSKDLTERECHDL
jgi:hypothetical protein